MNSSDIEKSFKAKLRAISKEKNRDPADLWQYLVLERFLVRLAHSNYRNHFVLKGAILLSRYLDISRETKDLDLLALKLSNKIDELKPIFDHIFKIKMEDGFIFQEAEVRELDHVHMGYPGAQVTAMAYFGKIRFKLSVDIAFGDVIEPIRKSINLIAYSKGPLFEDSIELLCYPKEFIFAEKLRNSHF